MPDDPQFVRLANRLSRGIVADVEGSGWSISGLDVKPFPKDQPAAARFVRHGLRDGKLEVASRAEHEEVQDEARTVENLSHQEAQVMGAALEGHARLSESRAASTEDDDEDEDEAERLRQFEDETDDAEEQASRNPQRKAPAGAPKAKSKNKSKSKRQKEEAVTQE